LDPLDPLTEIVKSGQGFSSFIFIERLIWLIIGFFFIGAMSTSIQNGMKDQGWFGNKSFMISFNKKTREDDKKKIDKKGNNEEKE
tara:strand:- start:273 stop:527 length:255 start_codon:yes stop_codon:yes gene_type:complete